MKYLKIYIALFLFLSNTKSYAQNYDYCRAGLFSEYSFYSDLAITKLIDVVYGNNFNYQGNPQDLKLNLYFPNINIDPLPKRPLIVLLHGGGFDVGSKNDFDTYSNNLAKAGYVVASIDYRLGWSHAGGLCNGDANELKLAMYRAIQDGNAALRFLVNKASDYKIDTSFIFLAGQSEGSMTAIHIAFMNQQDADISFPNCSATLGPINLSGNLFTDSYTIKGVFNWCGAVIDTNMIQSSKNIPLLSIHGLHDSIMQIGVAKYFHCTDTNNHYPILFGPKMIYQRMLNVGICSQVNYDPDGEHCIFPSLEPINYIPAKFTCFFKNLLCGNCTSESKISYNQKSCVEAAPLVTSSIDEISQLDFFPNPNSGNLTLYIRHQKNESSHIQIDLLSLQGTKFTSLYSGEINSPIFKKDFHFLNPISKGMYFLKVQIGNSISYKKIIFN